MASNNPQRSQVQGAQVQPGVRPVKFSQSQCSQLHYVPPRHAAPSDQTSLPRYLPPSQPVPVLSSMSSDNEVKNVQVQEARPQPGYTIPYQTYNIGLEVRPQLGYTIPYQPYNIAGGFPFTFTVPAQQPIENHRAAKNPGTATIPPIQHAQVTL
jgi:hypothetical protein